VAGNQERKSVSLYLSHSTNQPLRSMFYLMYVLLFLSLVVACDPSAKEDNPTFVAPPITTSQQGKTYIVQPGTLADIVEARGRVGSRQESLLAFPLSGRIEAVEVAPGDVVEEGTILAELDAPDLEQQLEDAQYDLRLTELELSRTELRAQSQTALAQIDLVEAERALSQAQAQPTEPVTATVAQELAQLRLEAARASAQSAAAVALAEAEYEQDILLAEAAEAARAEEVAQNIEQAQASLESLRMSTHMLTTTLELDVTVAREKVERARVLQLRASEQLSNTLLVAPFSGKIVSIEKQPGDQVAAYETIGLIADPTDLWLVATVFVDEIDRVTVGQPATIRLDAYPEQTYTGSVLQVASEAIMWQGRNAFEVIIAFDAGQNVPAIIRMGADVAITGPTREGVLVVPSQAVLTRGGQSYVDFVVEAGQIERVEVKTGATDGVLIEIVSGLNQDDVIRIP
jgi:HlyD family secretion protein